MLTARSFLAWLLVALSVAAGVAAVTHSLVDGAAAVVLLPAGLIGLLPHPERPASGTWRVTIVKPAREAEILWAEDWDEPLMPYRFQGHSLGEQRRPAAHPRRSDSPGQVRADRSA